MVWAKAFERFDPFDPTQLHLPGYGLVVERVLPLLKNRSRAELEYGLRTLVTIEGDYREQLLYQTIEQMGGDGTTIRHSTQADIVRYAQERFDISKQDAFQNARWSEYFALLALGIVGELVSQLIVGGIPADEVRKHLQTTRTNLETAFEAMDALVEATAQARTERAQDAGRIHRERGGRKRMEPYHRLREKVLALHDQEHSGRSAADAARRIYKNLEKQERAVFHTDGPVDRLTIWIRDHRRP